MEENKYINDIFKNAIDNELNQLSYGDIQNMTEEILHDVAYNICQRAKAEILKDAIDAKVGPMKSLIIPSLGIIEDKLGLNYGDKLKIILIKEDDD